jgi:hypothetical protein
MKRTWLLRRSREYFRKIPKSFEEAYSLVVKFSLRTEELAYRGAVQEFRSN